MKSKSGSVLYLVLILSLCLTVSQNILAQQQSELPKEKQTKLGLYLTSKEAYEMWKADPDKIKILDVRTLEEYIYIGHAPMAWNIPVFFQSHNWDESKKHFSMSPNPDFMKHINEVFKTDDTILVTCRSGGRSAMAVNRLTVEGFKNVYNITDGFEGDTVNDTESVFIGQRMKNGWKNSGLPFTYKLDPNLLRIDQ